MFTGKIATATIAAHILVYDSDHGEKMQNDSQRRTVYMHCSWEHYINGMTKQKSSHLPWPEKNPFDYVDQSLEQAGTPEFTGVGEIAGKQKDSGSNHVLQR